jgi:DNA-binding response OmpR family regulator
VAKILLVEDDATFSRRLNLLLKAENHVVDNVFDGDNAMDYLAWDSHDIIILDWKLPGLSGLELCRRYREKGGKAGVLMLTGNSAIGEKTTGLDAGADDYITKPFEPEELMARLRALLRRPVAFKQIDLKVGSLSLNPKSHTVTRDGVDLELSRKEFLLLEFLMRNVGCVFSSDAILDRVWKSETEVSSQTVRAHIQRLRAKIDTPGKPSPIQTISGVGYRLNPECSKTD